MNRLLLKECLDELRSDDSVELTEAHNNRRKEKKRTRGDSGRPLSGHSDRPRAHNSERSPTRVGLNAEQNLASLRQSLSQGRRLSQGQMLKELVRCLGGEEMDNYDDTRYYRRASIGTGLLRVGDHRGHADEFAKRGEWTGNYGIDINLPWSWRRFREDKRVDYKEEVYMPQDMTAENEIKIVDGVVNWIRTGVYTGPAGWETNISVRTLNPDGTPIQASPQGGQPPTPPASPPTGPGVLESLAAKYFKEAHNMKYRLLKEAALEELIHEDWMGYSPEERRRLNRWQRSDIRDAEPYIPQAMIRGKTRRKSDSGEYTGPIIPAGQEFMERRRADALDPLFSQCLRYLRAMDKTSGEYQEMKDLMKQGRYREALRRFSQYDEFHFTPEYDEEERKRAKGEYGEYPDFGHADLTNPDVDAAFRDGQI